MAAESPRWIIRSMQMAELAFAAECTAAEGWAGGTLSTFEGFYQHDPNGCFLAELAGRPAGICIATPYGRSGFVGMLIVRPEARGRGIGAALLNHTVEYLHQQGAKTIYLDGVVKAAPLYERNGFRKVCRSLRFSGTRRGESHSDVRAMRTDDLPAVLALDRQAFGADRSFLLARRLQSFPELCQVLVEDGKLTGFILGQHGEGWAVAGPWVIAQEARAPLRLLDSLARQTGKVSIGMGVLETNRRAVELIRSLGFAEREDSPWRMALGPSGDLGASPMCFAVGTAATG
jgi:ribosomal protein S18 acetylase RimI-like enzyme